jgi:glyoxylase-like metal-dependent hydrolase (beta-lactamase superfamily II)
MKIDDGVEMLELSMNMGGVQRSIYPVILWDDNTLILVDSGFPGQMEEIREKMDNANIPFEKLDIVIVTHQDIDHIGGLPDILKALNHKVKIFAHEEDKPYIQGEKRLNKITPERVAQLNAQLNSMPEKQGEAMKALLEKPPKANIDKTVVDGEELPYCGGIIIIHTPGHTPGHICLYLKQSKTLIAGDSLNIIDGELVGPNPQNTPDMDSAIKSLKKFIQHDIENVICYHGGLYTKNANQRIAELAK